MSIRAEAAWEINTIIIALNGSVLHARPGKKTISEGDMDLTLKEAKALVLSLITAIETYEYIEKRAQEDFGEKNEV